MLVITSIKYICKLDKLELNADDSIELLLFDRVEFVNLIFEPLDTLATKLFRIIM